MSLAEEVPWEMGGYDWDDPHAKTYLLLQAHMASVPLPISDYITDLKSVLDQSARVLQAIVDVAAQAGHLTTALQTMALAQCIIQGRLPEDDPLLIIPGADELDEDELEAVEMDLPGLMALPRKQLVSTLKSSLGLRGKRKVDSAVRVLTEYLPRVSVTASIKGKGVVDDVVSVSLTIRRLNVARNKGGKGKRRHALGSKAYAPRFPRPVREGWWLVIGLEGELLALKRIGSLRTSMKTSVELFTPDVAGVYDLDVYFVSDCYVGLNVETRVRMVVGE